MKILLIQPPYVDLKSNVKRCQPPLGLAYLAAVLGKNNEVVVLDTVAEGFEDEEPAGGNYRRYGLSFEKIKNRISLIKPDMVGVSCLFTTQADNIYELCRLVKECDSRIITVIGGAHPSALPDEALGKRDIDYVIIGEGEDAFSRLVECIKKGVSPSDIDGIGYKENNRAIVKAKKNYITVLDSLPFPDWSLFPLESYFRIGRPHGVYPERKRFLPVISSRGCPNNCIFCSVHNLWGRNYRKRSAANVLAEIKHLTAKYGIEEIYFEDDNLTLDKQRSLDIFTGMLKGNFNIKWSCPNGVFIGTLDDEMISLMKKSGCRALGFGIESGDKHMLRDVIDKSVDLDKVKPILKKVKDLGIEISIFFVLGLPGETRDTLDNTFRYAAGLPAENILFFFATPLPGTRLMDKCKGGGALFSGIDYKDFRSENAILIPDGMSREEFIRKVKFGRNLIYAQKAIFHPFWAISKIREKLF